MYDIEADTRNNRLYIDLRGSMDRSEIEDARDETLDEARKLDAGFDIVNDLSGFKPFSPDAAEPVKEAQEKLHEMGVDRVVRVVDEETSNVVVNAFERRSRDVGYEGLEAGSTAEAERLLSPDRDPKPESVDF